ncbi:sensor histidine kinase [Clostridium sp. BJN0013]|uniref:sensor histidine kinase n=1 Tax=Clostridium sp. BJN0013 TaxID=3236840 RepID=UPI0034C62CA4
MSQINFVYLSLIIFTPIKIFGYSDMIYMSILMFNCLVVIITLVKAILKKRKFAWLLLTGIIVMIFTTIIDILYVNNYVNIYFSSGNYILGLLFFLLCEIYVLSVDVMDAFESSNKAKDIEIAFLQAQIAPHFFFNTLNNIYCLMDQSVPKSKELILNFCDFLRVKHKFDYRKNIFYSLREEIDLIKSYVKIENARFNDSIHLIIDIKEEYMLTPIPQLLIQPIVENSIKHGLKSGGITINIIVLKKNNNLEIIVSDNGKGIGKDVLSQLLHNKSSISGVGLKNVNFRLMKCYQSKLKIVSKLSYGTSISFEIPENKYKIGGE